MNRFTKYFKPINIHVREKGIIDGTINVDKDKKDKPQEHQYFDIPQGEEYFNNPDFIISQNSPDLVYNNKYYTRINLKSIDTKNKNPELIDHGDNYLDGLKALHGDSLVIKSLRVNPSTYERELVVDLLRFKDIHDKPTTLEGYGIEDAASKTDIEKLQNRFDGSFVFKKRIATNSDLDDISKKKPKEGEENKDQGPQKGDVYRVEEEKRNYYWDGSEWVPFCGTDSLYWFGTVWPEPNFEQREIKWGGPGFKEKKQ